MTQADDGGSKLHIDSDWKAQAQAEKERLAQKEQELEAKRAAEGERGEMPEASFRTLVGVLATQAMMGLGMYADRESGKAIIDLMGSRFNIDLLGVLEEKTKGNLDEEEKKELTEVLSELRAQYVHIATLVAQHQAGGGQAGAGGIAGTGQGGAPAGGGPQIIQP